MGTARRGPDGLTDFEREICHAVDRGLGDREAYRELRPKSTTADQTAASTVWGIRHRPHCAAYLADLKAKSLSRHLDRKDRITEELATVAFADIGVLLGWGPHGLTVKRIGQLSPVQRRALSAVTITRSAQGATVRLVMHDKLAALEKLCKMFGLYAPAEAKGAGDAPAALSDVERAQRLAAILRLADGGASTDGAAAEDGAEAVG